MTLTLPLVEILRRGFWLIRNHSLLVHLSAFISALLFLLLLLLLLLYF
jgi:hypothetical protein